MDLMGMTIGSVDEATSIIYITWAWRIFHGLSRFQGGLLDFLPSNQLV